MKPNITVLFCDDIRHELGGKVSLMGVYGSHLLVHTLPVQLPKLAVHFNIEMPTEMKPDSIKVNIVINGKNHTSLELGGIGYNDTLAKEIYGHRITGGTDLNQIDLPEKTKIEAIVELDGKKAYSSVLIVDTKDNFDAMQAT
ncbi:DUF6941 family protein [Rheinheimera fenheensis]|uniref:DUF6941 family protein n=1 Tax=Rheinheimera fenheensis TaxID=3152295 RepID=UPI0032614E6C